MISSIRIISYEENNQNNGQALLKNLQNNHKNFTKEMNKKSSNSMAVYRITPIISEDLKNISYPILKVTENEHELKEITEKLMKAHETNDLKNSNFIVESDYDNDKKKNFKEETNNDYEIKKPDEEDRQARTPFDKFNLIKAFCICHDTYNNRLEIDEDNDVELKIQNLDQKLNFLFDV